MSVGKRIAQRRKDTKLEGEFQKMVKRLGDGRIEKVQAH